MKTSQYFLHGDNHEEIKQAICPMILEAYENDEFELVAKGVGLHDVLRLAKISEKIGDFVMREYGMHGVPLKHPAKFFKHQEEVLKWALTRESDAGKLHGIRGGIIALTMGMGKGLVGLTLAQIAPKIPFLETNTVFPTLVVCSKTILYEWYSNAKRFYGNHLKILYFHKDITDANILASIQRRHIITYEIVVTTYDTILSVCRKGSYDDIVKIMGTGMFEGKIVEVIERPKSTADRPELTGFDILYGTPWRRIIADESQRFANYKTKTYRALMSLYGDMKWCLTGTPIRNYSTDIWAQMRFLGYIGHATHLRWGISVFRRHKLEQALFRRNWDSAPEIKPPEKIVHTIPIKHIGNEAIAHQILLRTAQVAFDEFIAGTLSYANILVLFLRLRQVSIAAYLTTPDAKRKKESDGNLDERIQDMLAKLNEGDLGIWIADKTETSGMKSAKVQTIIDVIRGIPSDEKILVFSSFTSCLDLVSDALSEYLPTLAHAVIDGGVSGRERFATIERFKNNPSFRVLLLHFKVGGEGLNLQEANHVICIEPWWNSAVTKQAEARCWRPGQNRKVHVYNIIVTNSIEQSIVRLCIEKDKMAANYLEGKNNKKQNAGLSIQAIQSMLFAPETSTPIVAQATGDIIGYTDADYQRQIAEFEIAAGGEDREMFGS